MFLFGLVKMLPIKKSPAAAAVAEYYDQLIHQVFRPEWPAGESGKVIAIAPASAGAGASTVIREIGRELANQSNRKTVVIAAERLLSIELAELKLWLNDCAKPEGGLVVFDADPEKTRIIGGRQECMELLRRHFDCVLVDFPSSKMTSGIAALAEMTDGFVIVVAGGETRREEIERSRRLIETVGGKILGLVLNKRRYPVPNWLYKKM